MADLTQDDVKRILEIIDSMRDADVRLELGELKLHVSRQAGARSTMPAAPVSPASVSDVPPSPSAAQQRSTVLEVPAGQVAVRAPTMGTFYRAPSPGARPYVEVGDRVQADDTVAMFEVMKLFTSLKAGVAGIVTQITVSNESLVEQDQPLVLIAPAA